MDTSNESLFKPLPFEITQNACTFKSREHDILDFLKTYLPNTDTKDIVGDIDTTYILDKVKSHMQKVKPKKKTFLSSRQRKRIGIKTIGLNTKLKYADFLPLKKLWLQYVLKTLEIDDFCKLPVSPTDPQWETMNLKLMRADLHGADMAVVKSKCPSLIGIRGILIQETKNAFRVIGEDNTVRTIPKMAVVVDIFLVGVKLTLFGKEFCIRPAERCVKKFKAVHIPQL
ncbi:ribonuclease P protein subunit p29 [Chelonus insularis]|uniref:ribonuclease P protein subunit p29 n=1 Tax=Chelonus insularis TaxID=460826 RepID=UPI00158E2C70|nr:ribonuclease P protein subunit p29 [Chelonus insularis]